jgi:hypothetical protein
MKIYCNAVLLWSPWTNHHHHDDNNKNEGMARHHKLSLGTFKDRNNTIYRVLPSSAFWKRSTEITSENLLPNSLSNNNKNNNNNIVADTTNGFIIALLGVFLGQITWMPNMMMIDSETTIARYATNIGIFASISFVIGGVMGAIYQKHGMVYYPDSYYKSLH